MKLLSLAILLLVTEAIASKVSYSTKYTEGGISGKGANEVKAGGTIDDDKDDTVLDIASWSENKFTAKRNARSGVIIVSKNGSVKTKSEATESNNEAQQAVNKKLKE
ncbi:hypothetical protein BO70DRAFT_362034 [Aspergillus heteromorphus CBS 117.55]|uniref:Uncharacterized protein n=1 Tax=Aspergillus heteromorphus CBS 117.55 TaxID=1448321 RepID=A0A317WAR6_9EURO|nr:uncharacterized protein BO70DRAFT_362034 [Aspergillus heteromorphus CBS 117.55]PWY82088.1 hypothetical protein BO70DRAFT_362034 [Aspergillus heteromorphus CBS 117.55]